MITPIEGKIISCVFLFLEVTFSILAVWLLIYYRYAKKEKIFLRVLIFFTKPLEILMHTMKILGASDYTMRRVVSLLRTSECVNIGALLLILPDGEGPFKIVSDVVKSQKAQAILIGLEAFVILNLISGTEKAYEETLLVEKVIKGSVVCIIVPAALSMVNSLATLLNSKKYICSFMGVSVVCLILWTYSHFVATEDGYYIFSAHRLSSNVVLLWLKWYRVNIPRENISFRTCLRLLFDGTLDAEDEEYIRLSMLREVADDTADEELTEDNQTFNSLSD
mmetsp:Transcript_9443/g.14156  ORF Transcript_9443/g.14156 Transcript_9443/m.14156 type:complete len:279 (+) Transcript_9443:58-894(+)